MQKKGAKNRNFSHLLVKISAYHYIIRSDFFLSCPLMLAP
jgi:hypothetical protein